MTAGSGRAEPPPRVAAIGCGHWGRNLVRNLHALGALAAVCDEAEASAREVAQDHAVPLRGFDAILDDPAITAVALATPAATHAALALRALAAGKHVFVEKPLALAVPDAMRVAEAAAARGRVLMVGHLLQYHPAFLKLRELVRDGALGRLRFIQSTRLSLGRIRREEDVFWSFAPHDISMILALTGELPDRVEAVGHCHLHDRIADVATAHLRFPGGVSASVFVSWLHPAKEQKLVVVGENGMAVFDDGQPWTHKLLHYPHRIDWQGGLPTPARAEARPVPLPPDEPLRQECRHFLSCVRDGARPRTDAREGIGVLRVLDAARRAMASGAPASLDPAPAPRYFAHETACVDAGCEIGDGTRIWHFSHILKGSRIGPGCVIGQNVVIGPDVRVGPGCKIQNNVSLYSGVLLEGAVFCGPSCVFTNVTNPRAEIERKSEFRPTPVGFGATIGANATIICGHSLGRYCLVGAGAVVTRDVPAHALVIGNPARRVGWVSRAGHRLTEALVCPETRERYAPDGRGGLAWLEEARDVA